jgi:hypothetical protein
MKAIRGMMRGVRQDPKPTKTEQLIALDKELKNLQMAGRVSQMMIQQLMQSVQNLSKDVAKSFGVISEMQYKILAMQSVGNFDMAAMAAKAEELRLNDFIEASDAEDKAGNFTIGDVVQEDSTVIITSTTNENTGIFRSRIKLADCGVPALIRDLAGKPIGTKVTCQLNGEDHVVELLGVRNPPPAVTVVEVPANDVVVNGDSSASQVVNVEVQ